MVISYIGDDKRRLFCKLCNMAAMMLQYEFEQSFYQEITCLLSYRFPISSDIG